MSWIYEYATTKAMEIHIRTDKSYRQTRVMGGGSRAVGACEVLDMERSENWNCIQLRSN